MARTTTSFLVLGLISRGHRTGYEMKTVIERGARFFWTASYGQLYPELKRLEADGLITGSPDPDSGRGRTLYALTAAGEEALDAWLHDNGDLQFELRAEGLLKLFLARDAGRDAQLAVVAGFRAQAAERHAVIAALTPPRELGRHIQAYGTALYEATVAWCDDLEAAIRRGDLEDDVS